MPEKPQFDPNRHLLGQINVKPPPRRNHTVSPAGNLGNDWASQEAALFDDEGGNRNSPPIVSSAPVEDDEALARRLYEEMLEADRLAERQAELDDMELARRMQSQEEAWQDARVSSGGSGSSSHSRHRRTETSPSRLGEPTRRRDRPVRRLSDVSQEDEDAALARRLQEDHDRLAAMGLGDSPGRSTCSGLGSNENPPAHDDDMELARRMQELEHMGMGRLNSGLDPSDLSVLPPSETSEYEAIVRMQEERERLAREEEWRIREENAIIESLLGDEGNYGGAQLNSNAGHSNSNSGHSHSHSGLSLSNSGHSNPIARENPPIPGSARSTPGTGIERKTLPAGSGGSGVAGRAASGGSGGSRGGGAIRPGGSTSPHPEAMLPSRQATDVTNRIGSNGVGGGHRKIESRGSPGGSTGYKHPEANFPVPTAGSSASEPSSSRKKRSKGLFNTFLGRGGNSERERERTASDGGSVQLRIGGGGSDSASSSHSGPTVPAAIPPPPTRVPQPTRNPGPFPHSVSISSTVPVAASPQLAAAAAKQKKKPMMPTRQAKPQSSLPICSVCHQPALSYLATLDKKYHPSCFKCMGCHEVIDPSGPFAYMTDERGQRNPLHRTCYAELYGVKCTVCKQSIPAGPDGKVSYVKHPFFDSEHMCPSHASNPGRRCTGCHRFEPIGNGFADLGDANRCVCYSCCRTVVVDSEDAKPLWKKVIGFFESLGLPIWPDMREVPILVVGFDALNDQLQNSAHSGSSQIMTRGLCLSEHQSGRRIALHKLKFDRKNRSFLPSDPESNGFTFFQVPDASKINPDSSVTAILCLSGLPADLTASVLAHEATHAWFKLHPSFNIADPIPLQVEEGCCQLMAQLFLTDGLDPASTDTYDDKGPSDEKLRQYFKFSIETDENRIYGEGYRMAATAHAQIGIQALLSHVVMYKEFPVVS